MKIIEKILFGLVLLALVVMFVGLVLYQITDSGIVVNNEMREVGMLMMMWSMLGGLVSGALLVKS